MEFTLSHSERSNLCAGSDYLSCKYINVIVEMECATQPETVLYGNESHLDSYLKLIIN